jgi:hypothetical protein
MTVTYLLAYFFTPNVFHVDFPILNVPFARVAEYLWPGKFVEIRYFGLDFIFIACGLLSSVPISIIHIRE